MPTAHRISLERTVGYIGLFCSILIIATTVGLAVKERDRLYTLAAEESATAAFFLADHASRLFEASDFVLSETSTLISNSSWDDISESHELWDRLYVLAERLPYVEAIWLNDSTGRLRLSTIQYPTPKSDASDRDFFIANKTPNKDLFVSKATRGRVTGRDTFLLTRRLNEPDGSMRGIVSVTVELSYFNEFYGSMNLPFSPLVRLFRLSDMGVIASYPAATSEHVTFASALSPIIPLRPAEGFVTGTTSDNGAATIAYHKIRDMPVYVGVVIPRKNLDRVWFTQVWVYGLLGGIALLALAALTLFAFRQSRQLALVQGELEGRVEQRTADLASANTELSTLFQEVHHRVKNNLQVVTSLLRLQQMRVASPHARSALQDSIDRIQAMGLVHQLLYSKQELSNVDFAEYAGTLGGQLVDAYGMSERISFAVAGKPVRFDLDTAIPMALIVNEIVSNALKHAFPNDRHGKIELNLNRTDDHVVLMIHDDGIGMPNEVDWTQPASLGLRIVRSLASQLSGTADFQRGEGTIFTLKIPAKAAA